MNSINKNNNVCQFFLTKGLLSYFCVEIIKMYYERLGK